MEDPDPPPTEREPAGGRPPDHRPFLERVREGFRWVDPVAVGSVPAVLFALFQLPARTRRALAFALADPVPASALTAHYVHLTGPHLLWNVTAYLLIVGDAYLLALANGRRTRFYTVLVSVLAVLPVPLSYLNLAVPRGDALLLGFSGLNMALVGYLDVEFAAYLERYFADAFGVRQAPLFFFLTTGFVAAPHAGTVAGLSVLAVSLLMVAVHALELLLASSAVLPAVAAAVDKQGYAELSVATALFLAVFVPVSFPLNPVADGATVAVFTHLLGFCLGFISVYLWVLAVDRVESGELLSAVE